MQEHLTMQQQMVYERLKHEKRIENKKASRKRSSESAIDADANLLHELTKKKKVKKNQPRSSEELRGNARRSAESRSYLKRYDEIATERQADFTQSNTYAVLTKKKLDERTNNRASALLSRLDKSANAKHKYLVKHRSKPKSLSSLTR